MRLSEYSLKYTFHHIASMDDEVARGGLLDGVCGNWGFLRRVFEAGQGAKMLKAIGGLAQGGGMSAYAMDSYRWLRYCFNEFEAKPGEMESVTIKGSPIETTKFLEANAKQHKICKPSGVRQIVRVYLVGAGNEHEDGRDVRFRKIDVCLLHGFKHVLRFRKFSMTGSPIPVFELEGQGTYSIISADCRPGGQVPPGRTGA